MKNYMLLFAFSFMTSYLLAQTSFASYEDVKKENEYLKKALSLNKPITELQNGDLTFSVIKVEGNSKSQQVAIEILVKNKGRNLEDFSSMVKSIFDINGLE